MRILTTSDLAYISGGEYDGGGGGGGEETASGPGYGLALAVCSVIAATTPTPPGFVTACVNALTGGNGGSGGGSGAPRDYGYWDDGSAAG